MTDIIQVSTTAEREADARRIARALVERRLAACVQVVGPVASTYWWKGTIETAREWLCLIKTMDCLYPAVEAAIKELHPYQTPEIIAVPLARGSEEYLGWVREETSRPA